MTPTALGSMIADWLKNQLADVQPLLLDLLFASNVATRQATI